MQYNLKRMLKMSHPSRQLNVANAVPAIGPAPLFGFIAKQLNKSLLFETVLVTTAAILAIKVVNKSSLSGTLWFIAPAILIAAALIPTTINKREFAKIGLSNKQVGHWLVPLGWACITTFPLMFFGLWLMKYGGLELPLHSQ